MSTAIENRTVESTIVESQNIFLMAEDNPLDAEIFSEMLKNSFGNRYSIFCVDRFKKILQALETNSFNALILDMNLPDSSGVNNVVEIGEKFPNLPIIVLTGDDDIQKAIDALQNGAQDYLSKNHVTPETLERSLRYASERKQIEQKLKFALQDAAFKNIQLEAQAKHDSLTGLANRTYFADVASRVIHRARRNKCLASLMYFDLNGFKKINDNYGHLAGDELLKQVSNRLMCIVRDTEFLARMGGDEFVIITDLLKDKTEIYPLLKRIQQQFDTPFKIGPHEISVSTSIGIAFYPEADSLDLLIKHADCAMYEAKSEPEKSICFYSGKLAAQYARTQKIESSFTKAIEKNELVAFFQPIISVSDPDLVYVEALARWHSSELGNISPSEFIPIAESTPTINNITQIISQKSSLLSQGLRIMGLPLQKIAINVDAYQLSDPHFSRRLLNQIEISHLEPNQICLELTERQVVQNINQCKTQIELLRREGITLALDDFGTGYSSITYLLDLPFDVLKIDRILIADIDKNTRNQALVAGIVEMAHRLDMKVVAEGIESNCEKDTAINLGCDFLQGFFYSGPMPLEEALLFFQLKK